VPSPQENEDARVALAVFAEAIEDPSNRKSFQNDSLQFFRDQLTSNNKDFDRLHPDVQEAFAELFGDLSYEELRLFARFQATMRDLAENKGFTSLVEDVPFCPGTLSKF
jgi:uncharacterized protein YutD